MHTLVSQPALHVMLAMVSIAAASDWKTGLIPNAVVALGAGLGVLVQLLFVVVFGAPLWASLASMALGLFACATLPLVLWLMGAMGGGDLKLFAAIGVCVGPGMGLDIQLWSHVIALLVLPVCLLRRGGARTLFTSFARLLGRETASVQLSSFRFAPAILVACVLVTFLRQGAP